MNIVVNIEDVIDRWENLSEVHSLKRKYNNDLQFFRSYANMETKFYPQRVQIHWKNTSLRKWNLQK